jgi:hypothetical protein
MCCLREKSAKEEILDQTDRRKHGLGSATHVLTQEAASIPLYPKMSNAQLTMSILHHPTIDEYPCLSLRGFSSALISPVQPRLSFG